jgi:hypothetical protein
VIALIYINSLYFCFFILICFTLRLKYVWFIPQNQELLGLLVGDTNVRDCTSGKVPDLRFERLLVDWRLVVNLLRSSQLLVLFRKYRWRQPPSTGNINWFNTYIIYICYILHVRTMKTYDNYLFIFHLFL